MTDPKTNSVTYLFGAQPGKSGDGTVEKFSADHAARLLRNLTAARSILRVVALAARTQADGSVQYENNSVMRWHPALDEACIRLQAVRDVLIQTGSAPCLDWFTPLALVEAMGAALWHGNTCSHGELLEDVELDIVAQVAIESLDSLMRDCEREGVCDMAHAEGAAAVH